MIVRYPRRAAVGGPPAPVVTGVEADCRRGIAKLEGRLIILLDLDKVHSWEEKRKLREVAA